VYMDKINGGLEMFYPFYGIGGPGTTVSVRRDNIEPMSTSDHDLSPSISGLMRGRPALTPATIMLVAINILVFAVMLAYGAGLWHSPNDVQLAWGAGFGPATKDGEWWRLGTAMFLHFGLVHLAMNMWALWDGGRLVERLYGSGRFAIIFICSGLTGNLLSLIVQGDRAVSGGASGAIFGIYGALLVWLWRERRRVHPTDFRWLFGGAAVFTAVTIGFGLLIPGIDNAAHIGGLISGALLGVTLARPLAGRSLAGGYSHWLAAATLVLAVIALITHVPAPSYQWQEELQARTEIRDFLASDERISRRWQAILDTGRHGGATFDQLAGHIESDIALEYQHSFEQLSALSLDPAAPSTMTIEILRKYALLRSEASHDLAEGLRLNDKKRISEALEKARLAPYTARGIAPPSAAPAQ
jgi:rhomboid protease GluP